MRTTVTAFLYESLSRPPAYSIKVDTYEALVKISGKVKRPMFYEMKKDESMKTLLSYAGGFRGDAFKKTVRLYRKSGSRYTVFNVDEFDMGSFKLSDEDSVNVDSVLPRYANMAEIKGAVFRPGMYQIDGTTTTIRSLIEQAEGTTEDAITNHAVMHRMRPDRTLEVLTVDIEGILAGTSPGIALQSEDVL